MELTLSAPSASPVHSVGRRFLGPAIVLWSGLIVYGWYQITSYEFTVENSAAVTSDYWPTGSALESADNRPTLLVFLHPKCPCSRATVAELGRLLTPSFLSTTVWPVVHVVATTPVDADADWWNTPTVHSALQLPAAKFYADAGGEEAARHGAVTSGTVALYGSDRRRLYSGGVTMSRGHEGGNLGIALLRAALVDPENTSHRTSPSFGCRLCLPNSPTRRTKQEAAAATKNSASDRLSPQDCRIADNKQFDDAGNVVARGFRSGTPSVPGFSLSPSPLTMVRGEGERGSGASDLR